MNRRDFVKHSSLTVAAAAASTAWLQGVFEGRALAAAPSIFDTDFGIGSAEMGKILAAGLSKGGDFADLFFEHRVNSSLFFEEDIVKNASRGIIQGVGVRVVKGDQVGFAFTEDLTLASMTEAALTAAAIANDKTAKARTQAIKPFTP